VAILLTFVVRGAFAYGSTYLTEYVGNASSPICGPS